MTNEERESLDVAAMQRELLSIGAKVEQIGEDTRNLLVQKAEVDGKLAVKKSQLAYLKQQASVIQSVLKSSSQF